MPRTDRPNILPLNEYEKIDGFHEKPYGADEILHVMEQEAKELKEPRNERLDELKKMENEQILKH